MPIVTPSRFTHGDNTGEKFGDGDVWTLIFDTTDANANVLVLSYEGTPADDPPAFIIGDSIKGTDLGGGTLDLNAVTQPTFGIGDTDGDTFLLMDFSADDEARIRTVGTSRDLTIDATGNLLLLDTVAIGSGAPTDSQLNVISSGTTLAEFESTGASATGPILHLVHDSGSPANSDIVGHVRMSADDSAGVERKIGEWVTRFLDVTDSTMDSDMIFRVMNNVNQGDAGTNATLSSAGVWTDASAAEDKAYEGDDRAVFGGRAGHVLADKLKTLSIGRYHSSRIALGDPIRERHYSPTAEAWHPLFGLGYDPTAEFLNKDGVNTNTPGIAAKDMAGVALGVCKELIARIEILEAK